MTLAQAPPQFTAPVSSLLRNVCQSKRQLKRAWTSAQTRKVPLMEMPLRV